MSAIDHLSCLFFYISTWPQKAYRRQCFSDWILRGSIPVAHQRSMGLGMRTWTPMYLCRRCPCFLYLFAERVGVSPLFSFVSFVSCSNPFFTIYFSFMVNICLAGSGSGSGLACFHLLFSLTNHCCFFFYSFGPYFH